MKTYELYEDNAGGLHLAILDETGDCVYYLADNDKEFVLSALADFKAGSDPIDDCWDGGEENPRECYHSIRSFADARNGGAWEVEA